MAAMAARAIWKGSIYFGLVNIPISGFFSTAKKSSRKHEVNICSCKNKKRDMAVNK
jgi:non-homologous end joining protein Ku